MNDANTPPESQWPQQPISVDSSATTPPTGQPANQPPTGPAPAQSPYGATPPPEPRQQSPYRPPMGMPPGGHGGGPPPPSGGYAPPPYHRAPKANFWQIIAKIFGIVVFVSCMVCTVLFVVLSVQIATFKLDDETVVERSIRGSGNSKVAVIPIKGMIADPLLKGFKKRCKAILDDGNVKAVVLDIDSGGGTVDASEQMYQIVEKLKKNGKKVVAHYGGLAASGALYCSAGADKIYAQENTLTGSIGVLTSVVIADKLMREKLGIEIFTVTSTDATRKTLGSTMKLSGQFTDEDRDEVLRLLDHYHEMFVTRVFEGRDKKAAVANKVTIAGEVVEDADWDRSFVKKLANGGIYTYRQAEDCGLVDAEGDLDAAINSAANLAGLTAGSYKVVRYFDVMDMMMRRALIHKDINLNVNIGPVDSESVRLSRGRFMYLSRYRR